MQAARLAAGDSAGQNLREVHDDFARVADPYGYFSNPRELGRLAKQRDWLVEAFHGKPIERALEVGCAEGAFTETLEHLATRVDAVDISPLVLGRARERRFWKKHVFFSLCDLRQAVFPRLYDLVVVAGVLEYFHRRVALLRALDALVAALRPSGYLLLETTRAPGAESGVLARIQPQGRAIHDLADSHAGLKPVREHTEDWYVLTLYRAEA